MNIRSYYDAILTFKAKKHILQQLKSLFICDLQGSINIDVLLIASYHNNIALIIVISNLGVKRKKHKHTINQDIYRSFTNRLKRIIYSLFNESNNESFIAGNNKKKVYKGSPSSFVFLISSNTP